MRFIQPAGTLEVVDSANPTVHVNAKILTMDSREVLLTPVVCSEGKNFATAKHLQTVTNFLRSVFNSSYGFGNIRPGWCV